MGFPSYCSRRAQKKLAQTVESEVAEWIDSHSQLSDEAGHRQVAPMVSLPARTITTGVGPVDIKQHRGEPTRG